MPVSADDFIIQAEKTLSFDKNEISSRCSIKNSYYGAYHKVRSILKSPIVEYKGVGMHKGFIIYLEDEAYRHEKEIPRKQLKKFGLLLGQLKAERHKADYELDCNLSYEQAKYQLKVAQKVIQECTQLESVDLADVS